MSFRHRIRRLERRDGPRTFEDFVMKIMGLEGDDSEPDCVITIKFDGYMNVVSTTEVWREPWQAGTR